MSLTDRDAMAKAIALARQVEGRVSPNPYVGALVVRDGQIVGQGFHRGPGTMHAEIRALQEAGARAVGATLYSTLEPCCHCGPHKRTPPCVPQIVRAGIERVVCGTLDPNPEVRGKGIRILRDEGLEVVVGVAAHECAALNEGFFHFHRTGRPLVHLKVAQTLDGFLGPRRGPSGALTDSAVRARVHALRAEVDAIVVGAGTLRTDDPKLTVRDAIGEQPRRVVLAGRGALPPGSRLWNDAQGPVTLFVPETAETPAAGAQVEIVRVGETSPGRLNLVEVVDALARRGVLSILVEGGSSIAASFLEAELVDKLTVITVAKLAGSGKGALHHRESWPPKDLLHAEVRLVGNQVWHTGYLVERERFELEEPSREGAFECSRD